MSVGTEGTAGPGPAELPEFAPRSQALVSRLGALVVLLLAFMLAAPIVADPLDRYLSLRDAIAGEREVAAALAARASAMDALAQRAGGPPLVVAPDAAAAFAQLQPRIAMAAPPEAMRITRLELLPEEPTAPGLLRIGVSAEATGGGLRRFAETIEQGAPLLLIASLDLVPPALPVPAGEAPAPMRAEMVIEAAFAPEAAP